MENYKDTPLWDSDLDVEKRLDYLVQELCLEEKFTMLGTGCPAIPRMGITPSHVGGEAAHGIQARHDQSFDKGTPDLTTSFSQPVGMAATFDRELLKKAGEAVSLEGRALFNEKGQGSLSYWAPTIDMERDPRWGRTEEAYGEDPYLAGQMASAYIQGMRGEDAFYIRTAATLKHFYANNVEKNRTKITSSVDWRNMYEYYLEPFRIAIEEGGAEAVMTAYNGINGIPAMCNPQVRELLKEKWGLPGHVVCDGGAMAQVVEHHQYFTEHARTIAAALKAGVDCFTDDSKLVEESAKKAYEQGLIEEADMDRAIRNSFRTRIRLGFFDGKGRYPYGDIPAQKRNAPKHQKLARKMAAESVVLLKNENALLPAAIQNAKRIAVIGPHAERTYMDWYGGMAPYTVSVWQGMKEWGETKGVQVSYDNACDRIYIKRNGSYAMLGEGGRLCFTPSCMEEEKARKQAELFEVTDWGSGTVTLRALSCGLLLSVADQDGGDASVTANAKEAFGWFVRESFHMIPDRTGNRVCLRAWNDRQLVIDENGIVKSNYGEEAKDLSVEFEIVRDGIKEAERLAKEVDFVIAAVGCHPMLHAKEEIDRNDIELPLRQQTLLDALAGANASVAMVLLTNYPYDIAKQQQTIPAILMMSTGNMELGNGLADVLTGQCAPAGRLIMTWYEGDAKLPDMEDYDIRQHPRTYWYYQGKVQYPFGYGLSYTAFSYEEMKLKVDDKALHVSFTLCNTGDYTADEVVQLYIRKPEGKRRHPIKQLKGFRRVKDLAPGQAVTVCFAISLEDMRYYNPVSESMLLEDGEYECMIGASSSDIRQSGKFYLKGDAAPQHNLSEGVKAASYDASEGAECLFAEGNSADMGIRCYRQTISGKNADTVDKDSLHAKLVFEDCVIPASCTHVVWKCKARKGASLAMWIDGDLICEYRYIKDEWECGGKKLALSLESIEKIRGNTENIEIVLEGEIVLYGIWLLEE